MPAFPEAIERIDPGALGPESACGRVPVRGLLAVAKRRGMSIARLDLRNSGDTAGPRQRVVGYGSWALFEPEEGVSGLGSSLHALPEEPSAMRLALGLVRF